MFRIEFQQKKTHSYTLYVIPFRFIVLTWKRDDVWLILYDNTLDTVVFDNSTLFSLMGKPTFYSKMNTNFLAYFLNEDSYQYFDIPCQRHSATCFEYKKTIYLVGGYDLFNCLQQCVGDWRVSF